MKIVAVVAIGIFMLGMVEIASANLISYSDRVSFENQTKNFQLLNFDNLFYRPLPQDFSYGDTTLNAVGGLYSSGNSGNYAVGAENGGAINIHISPGHKAFGLDIGFLQDWSEQERLQYTLTGNNGVLYSNTDEPLSFVDSKPPVQKNGTFFGWISTDQDIIGITLWVYVPYVSAYATIDNITYDLPQSNSPTVPEPSTILLIIIGLAGFSGLRNKSNSLRGSL